MFLLAAAQPQAIGVHGQWGAFVRKAPTRCYAIARPVRSPRGQPFASVAVWPGARVRNQLHIRLSRPRNPVARVVLAIGDRRFELRAGPTDAWASDAEADRAIVAAMRGARSMSVETEAVGGAPFADVYVLNGAATAIDAAVLACTGYREAR